MLFRSLRGQRRVDPQRLIQILRQLRSISTRHRRQAQQDWQHKTFHARRRPAVVAGRRPRSASSMALCSSWPDDKPASSRKAPLVCATWMAPCVKLHRVIARSEEHTSELQSLMRISYAVFCLKKKTSKHKHKLEHTKNITTLI